jgi:hypothetical protein
MPIYLVKTAQGNRLVNAKHKAQAINHVVKDTITAEPITASDTVKQMGLGLKVEEAAAVPATPAAAE